MSYRLLDLFCGAGGAGEGYSRAGFEVVGVDINPQPHYPFEFHQADALEYPLNGFDVIHASPPCQRYTSLTQHHGKADKHPDLVGDTRAVLCESGVRYVIENVIGAPLVQPIMLCGSSFGLPLRRHRFFESDVFLFEKECRHEEMPKRFRVYDHGKWYTTWCVPVYGHGGGKADEHWPEARGIAWMTRRELCEATPPAYTEWIGKQLMKQLEMPRLTLSSTPEDYRLNISEGT